MDSGATHSVLTNHVSPLSENTVPVVGTTGKKILRPFLKLTECIIGNTKLIHEFLYMPECPLPLLGRDLLCKLNAQITFSRDSVQLHIPKDTAWKAPICLVTGLQVLEASENRIRDKVMNVVIPLVWVTEKPGKSKGVSPSKIELKPGARPVRKKQYPIKLEAWK